MIGRSIGKSVAHSLSTPRIAAGGGATPLLLDTYSGAAAAYSLRKLRNGYTGSAIRVRRASDSAEQDIGFSDNDLDTASLTSFCTGTDGFVTTWYDQSGNTNDATQATAIAQPKVYDATTGVLESGSKPTLSFASDFLTIADRPLTGASAFSFFGVVNFELETSYEILFSQSDGAANVGRMEVRRNALLNKVQYLDSTSSPIDGSIAINSQRVVIEFLASSSSVNAYINGTSDGSVTGRTIGVNDYPANIGARNINQYQFSGLMQELVLFLTDRSSSRLGINSNIATYYGITLS